MRKSFAVAQGARVRKCLRHAVGCGPPMAYDPVDDQPACARLPRMTTKVFPGGRIRKADYDPAAQELQLAFDNGNVLAYKHVPQEAFRRLCSAPNASTYL